MITTRTLTAICTGAGLCWTALAPGAVAADGASGLSATDAIVKATEVAIGHHVFNRHQPLKDGSIRPNRFRRVEVLAERHDDGSVRVLFSLPISSKVVSKGRMATQKLLEIRFTNTDPSTKRFSVDGDAISKGDDVRFCRALAAVLRKSNPPSGRRSKDHDNHVEFAVTISRRDGEELFLTVERVPYLPGGHTGYVVSKENEVLRVLRGA